MIIFIENRRRNAKPRNENYFEVIIPRYTDVQLNTFECHDVHLRYVYTHICIMHLYSMNVILFLWNYIGSFKKYPRFFVQFLNEIFLY